MRGAHGSGDRSYPSPGYISRHSKRRAGSHARKRRLLLSPALALGLPAVAAAAMAAVPGSVPGIPPAHAASLPHAPAYTGPPVYGQAPAPMPGDQRVIQEKIMARRAELAIAKARRAARQRRAARAAAAARAATRTAPGPGRPAAAAPAPQAAPAAGMSSFEQCVIAHESGGNPGAVNPSSGAGGLYQFLPSTWAGLGLGYPGGAQTAPPSVQREGFLKLYAEAGTAPWAGDGCA